MGRCTVLSILKAGAAIHATLSLSILKVRLRWFGGDLVNLL